jgi:hypothetical protein
MRYAAITLALGLALAHASGSHLSTSSWADEPKADPKKDYADFSRLIHRMVVKELPKEIEDKSGWGQIVPLTEPVRFPNLPRAKVRKGDKEGYPHGLWKKFKVRIPNPEKDLKIDVREFSKLDPKTLRVVVDTEAAVSGDGEVQNWQKGLPLGGASAQADAVIGLHMVFDVGVTLVVKKFPPDVIVEPKLAELQIDLKEFNLNRVANPRTGLAIEGETAKGFGNDMKDMLRGLIKNFEPDIKSRANEAISQALKEGKGNISAGALLKMAPPAKPKEK